MKKGKDLTVILWVCREDTLWTSKQLTRDIGNIGVVTLVLNFADKISREWNGLWHPRGPRGVKVDLHPLRVNGLLRHIHQRLVVAGHAIGEAGICVVVCWHLLDIDREVGLEQGLPDVRDKRRQERGSDEKASS
jgi:hypothetical protein